MKLKNFFRSEDGQMNVDWTVLVAGLIGVTLVVGVEVARGVENVTDEYDGINTGEGMMTMFVNNPESVEATEAVIDESDEVASNESDGSDDESCDNANPGNDKCVGNAGETPSGDDDDWGDGSHGRGDVSGNAGDDDDDGDDDGNNGRGNDDDDDDDDEDDGDDDEEDDDEDDDDEDDDHGRSGDHGH